MSRMKLSPTARIETAFGWPGFPDGLFYEADYSLRFELGGDLPMAPPRFLQGMDRARAVSQALFAGSSTLCAVVSHYAGERRTRQSFTAFQQLRRIGFANPFSAAEQVRQNDAEHIAEHGEDLCRYWYMADFENEPRSVAALLWASVSREMEITPSPIGLDKIHITDFENGLVLTAYDDRGMDVAARDPKPLSPLYDHYGAWLLDYDRPAMDQAFKRES